MTGTVFMAVAASVGAATQELVYWYNLRHQLEQKQYQALIRSRTYWLVVAAAVLMTGLAAFIWYQGAADTTPKEAFIFGIGLPLFVKQLAQSQAGKVKLGADSSGPAVSTYLRMR